MDKFETLKTLLNDDKIDGFYDLVELDLDLEEDVALLNGDGYVIKLFRDGTWEI